MPRLSKGVLYAEDAQDAANSVFESAERYDILDDNERATVLSVAQNVGQGGIQQAKIVATDMINDGGKQAARARRATRASAVLNTMTTTFQTADALAEAALRAAASGYETFDANVTVAGGPYPQANVDGRHAWRAACDGEEFHQNGTNVQVHPRQNKRAAGKGNVGGTLDTRTCQANFISTWCGRKINVHVDLPG